MPTYFICKFTVTHKKYIFVLLIPDQNQLYTCIVKPDHVVTSILKQSLLLKHGPFFSVTSI